MSNAAADGDTARMDRLGNLIEHLPDAETHPVLVATVHLARRMAEWRMRTIDERVTDDRAAADAARRADNKSLELNALLYGITDLTEAGLVSEAAEWFERFRARAAAVRQPVYDAFVLFIDATLTLLQGDYDEVDPPGRTPASSSAARATGATPSRRGPATCSSRPGTRAGWRRSCRSSRGWRDQAGLPIWDIARAAAGLAAGADGPAHATLAALVDDEVHVNDNSLWLTSVGLLVEVARAVGDGPRCEVLLRELTPYDRPHRISGLGRVSIGPVARFSGVAALVTGQYERSRPSSSTCRRSCAASWPRSRSSPATTTTGRP